MHLVLRPLKLSSLKFEYPLNTTANNCKYINKRLDNFFFFFSWGYDLFTLILPWIDFLYIPLSLAENPSKLPFASIVTGQWLKSQRDTSNRALSTWKYTSRSLLLVLCVNLPFRIPTTPSCLYDLKNHWLSECSSMINLNNRATDREAAVRSS